MTWDEYVASIEQRIDGIHSALEGKGPWPTAFEQPNTILGKPPKNLKRMLVRLSEANILAQKELKNRINFVHELQLRRIDYGSKNNPVAVDVQI